VRRRDAGIQPGHFQIRAPVAIRRRDSISLLERGSEAKLETQISSAVLTPVVAVVEYTYAIGDRIVIPAGARVYGSLQQADRSGLVSREV